MFVKIWNDPRGQDETDSWKKPKILCQSPFKLPDKSFCLPAPFNDTQCLVNHMHLCKKKRYTIIKGGRKVRFFNFPIPIWSTIDIPIVSANTIGLFKLPIFVSGRLYQSVLTFKVQFFNRPILLFVFKVRFMYRLIVNIKSASTVYTWIKAVRPPPFHECTQFVYYVKSLYFSLTRGFLGPIAYIHGTELVWPRSFMVRIWCDLVKWPYGVQKSE